MLNLTPPLRFYAKRRVANLQKIDRVATQKAQLFSLIEQAKNTKFGHDHGFDGIHSVADFQKQVPLRTYDQMWNEYWKAAYPVLEDCSWSGTVPYFCLSSGTASGTTKYLPYTHEMTRSNTKAGMDLLSFHLHNKPDSQIWSGRCFMIGGSTNFTEERPGIFSGDLSGIAVKELPWWAKPRYFPPLALTVVKNWEEKMQVLSKASLDAEITMISGVPAWTLLFLEEVLKLCPGKTIAEIYPKLELVTHGGVSFAPYQKRYAELLRGSKAELREVYPASEGFIAVADRGYGEGMRLMLDNQIFFEFIPLDELQAPNPTRHWIENIQTDVNYVVAMSTCAGCWSYVLGDTVRFVDTDPPRLLITGRTSYYLNAFGEHVIAEELDQAVTLAANKLNILVNDYSVGCYFPQKTGELGGHVYVIEYDSFEQAPELGAEFSAIIDKRLHELNEDYEGHRAKGFGLNPPQILPAKPGTFAAWMKSRGKLGGQNKVPRIITDQVLFDSLKKFAREFQNLQS